MSELTADQLHKILLDIRIQDEVNSRLSMFTIYDKSEGFQYRMCRWYISREHPQAVIDKNLILEHTDLSVIRRVLESVGLVKTFRTPTDDQNIIETWL